MSIDYGNGIIMKGNRVIEIERRGGRTIVKTFKRHHVPFSPIAIKTDKSTVVLSNKKAEAYIKELKAKFKID